LYSPFSLEPVPSSSSRLREDGWERPLTLRREQNKLTTLIMARRPMNRRFWQVIPLSALLLCISLAFPSCGGYLSIHTKPRLSLFSRPSVIRPTSFKLLRRLPVRKRWVLLPRSGSTVVPPPPSSQPIPTKETWEVLFRWIRDHGGYVHESLRVVEEAPCGARGVVTTENLAPGTPLFIVPEHLYITCQDARRVLGLTFKLRRNLPDLDQLPNSLQLAILVAAERAKGATSRWYPYLNSLPQQPCNIWANTIFADYDGNGDDVNYEAIAHLFPSSISSEEVRRIWSQVFQESMRIRNDLTSVATMIDEKIPSLGITKENLFWAYGMVTSRAFGNEDNDLGLAPGIDMMNHRSSAGCPFSVNFQMDFGPGTTIVVRVLSKRCGRSKHCRSYKEPLSCKHHDSNVFCPLDLLSWISSFDFPPS